MNDQYLMHYGIKGMKWGHRKQRERSNTRRSASSRKSARARRIARNVAIAGVAVGATVAAVGIGRAVLKNNKGVKLSSLTKGFKNRKQGTVKLLKDKRAKTNTISKISVGNKTSINGRNILTKNKNKSFKSISSSKKFVINPESVTYTPHKNKLSSDEFLNTVDFVKKPKHYW